MPADVLNLLRAGPVHMSGVQDMCAYMQYASQNLQCDQAAGKSAPGTDTNPSLCSVRKEVCTYFPR